MPPFLAEFPAFAACIRGFTDAHTSHTPRLHPAPPITSYGVGMIVGSSLGGVLASNFGYHFVAVLAAVLSMATVPFTMAVMEPSKDAVSRKRAGEKKEVCGDRFLRGPFLFL